MGEKLDFGREIIKDMMLDIDEEQRAKLLQFVRQDHIEDALQLGFEYNEKIECDTPQVILDEQFGKGYIYALRHIQEYLDKL